MYRKSWDSVPLVPPLRMHLETPSNVDGPHVLLFSLSIVLLCTYVCILVKIKVFYLVLIIVYFSLSFKYRGSI